MPCAEVITWYKWPEEGDRYIPPYVMVKCPHQHVAQMSHFHAGQFFAEDTPGLPLLVEYFADKPSGPKLKEG